jgi:outer membrane protein assembly factor BamA
MTTRVIYAAVFAAVLVVPPCARATEDDIDTERTLSEIVQDKRLEEAKARGDTSKRDTTAEEDAIERQQRWEQGKKESSRAIVPQIGYSPENGAKGGIKFTDRDIRGLTLDVSGVAAQRGQLKGHVAVAAPDLLWGWVILYMRGGYESDPHREFFGLGNNDVGPDELSTTGYQQVNGRLALGLRLSTRFLLVGAGEYNDVRIYRGTRLRSDPFTVDRFPNLAGIGGGKTSPLSVSIIFDDRDDVTRPTRGWNVIAKYQRIDRALDNDFEFNRYIFEASYLYPLLTRRQIIGLRVGGDYIDTKRRRTPFFEYSSLGGGDDLRGYFFDRFLGQAKFIAGGEYRLKIFDFNFFNIWNVKIDGVGFGDAARVFLDRGDLASEFGQPESTLPKTKDTVRFSYGGGVRFALGEAILARVDVGFSDEEHGLVYLVFGHTF